MVCLAFYIKVSVSRLPYLLWLRFVVMSDTVIKQLFVVVNKRYSSSSIIRV